jgi:flavin reductase (DIM6/NTAB) family NADH-FMN oxidoreductase RutF
MTDYQRITTSELDILPSRTRANLINKLSGYKSPVLIGTTNTTGIDNLSIVTSLLHIGSHPPLLGFVLRPQGLGYSHTLKNIKASKQLTISHIHEDIVHQAHRCSAKFPENISEFEAVKLTPYICELPFWTAPAVEESKIRMGLSLNSIIELPNKCNLIIGRIEWVESKEASFSNNEIKFDSNNISVLGLYEYYQTNPLLKAGYEEI